MLELEQRNHIPQQSAWFEEAIEFLTPPTETISSKTLPQSSSAQVHLLPSGPASAAGPPAVSGSLSVVQDPKGATSTADHDFQYYDLIESMIQKDFAHVSAWEDITVDAKIKKVMAYQILVPLALPAASIIGMAAGVLLHGVPGCGKTYLCRALAKSAGLTFFNVECSSLISKWQGDSEKWVVRTLGYRRIADNMVG